MVFAGPSRLPIVSGSRRLEFNLTRPQSHIQQSKARHRAIVTGRRFGKTTLTLEEIITSAAQYPWSENWYVGPTFDQAEETVWEALIESLEPAGMILKRKDLTIELKNRSLIALKSGQAYERMRGKGLLRPVKMVCFDEMRHIPIDAWKKVVRPILADRKILEQYGSPGRAMFTGTPGGFDDFKTLFDEASITPGWESFQYTSIQGGNITLEEIEQMRQDLSEKDFRQELEASFEALTGLCYHAYKNMLWPLGNLDPEVSYDPALPILVGMDFNVNPMTATISHRRTVNGITECHTFDEFNIPDSHTEEMAAAINLKYPKAKKIVFPDPHGSESRTTKAKPGQTDAKILRDAGFLVFLPTARSYPVRDRYNTSNGLLCNAKGVRRLKIHPRCKHLIKCYNGLTYKEGTNDPDKSLGIEHIGDAEGYMHMGAFPAGVYNSSLKELQL